MKTRVLILGGTGMLAEASRVIVRNFEGAVLLARKPEALAEELGVEGIAVDWTDRQRVREVIEGLQGQEFELLVSWVHREGLWCIGEFEGLLGQGGRSIRVHGSAAGDPAAGLAIDPVPRAGIVRQNVVLGWVMEHGRKRWLSDEEISGGVLRAYRQAKGTSFVVGEVHQA